MKHEYFSACLKCSLLFLLFLAACRPSQNNPPPPTPSKPSASTPQKKDLSTLNKPPYEIVKEKPGRPQLYLNEAQKGLQRMNLFVGTAKIDAELAITTTQIATGMMHRQAKDVGENEGMLFVFQRPKPVAFYMRNTHIPLSCAYIDPEGQILEIHDMTPREETAIPSTHTNIQYVLEVHQGWFEKNNIHEKMVVVTERGTFQETFFGK